MSVQMIEQPKTAGNGKCFYINVLNYFSAGGDAGNP